MYINEPHKYTIDRKNVFFYFKKLPSALPRARVDTNTVPEKILITYFWNILEKLPHKNINLEYTLIFLLFQSCDFHVFSVKSETFNSVAKKSTG
jgi:hypothetical protein